ncbi:MmyB family transcriptional regulator [Nonomuraea sp. NPDC003707]
MLYGAHPPFVSASQDVPRRQDRPASPPAGLPAHDHVSPGLLYLLDQLTETPAHITNDIGDLLARNQMADALRGCLCSVREQEDLHEVEVAPRARPRRLRRRSDSSLRLEPGGQPIMRGDGSQEDCASPAAHPDGLRLRTQVVVRFRGWRCGGDFGRFGDLISSTPSRSRDLSPHGRERCPRIELGEHL